MTTPAQVPVPAPAPQQQGPTDDEIFQKRPFEFALGRGAMNFGALEYSVVQGIKELLPFLPASMLGGDLDTSFIPALNTYNGFVRRLVRDSALWADHKRVDTQLRVLGPERNGLLHGAWFDVPGKNIDWEKGKVKRHTKLRDLLSGQAPDFITPAMILDFSNRVYATRRVFDAHRARILAHVQTTQVGQANPKP